MLSRKEIMTTLRGARDRFRTPTTDAQLRMVADHVLAQRIWLHSMGEDTGQDGVPGTAPLPAELPADRHS